MFWWKRDWTSLSWREMSEFFYAKFGWQHRANMSLEEQRFASHWAELSHPVKALFAVAKGSAVLGGSHCTAHQQSNHD